MQLQQVVELLQKGASHKGFDALYAWFEPQAIGFLIKFASLNREEAEDVLQETLIKVFKNLDQLVDFEKFESWIWKVLRRTMLDKLKALGRRGQREVASLYNDEGDLIYEESTLDPELHLKDDLNFSSPDDCVSHKLELFQQDRPDHHFALRAQMDGFSVKEISTMIGRSLSATKEFLSQSRKKVAPYIEDCIGVEINE